MKENEKKPKWLKYVTFLPVEKKILIHDEKTVLDLALNNEIDIDHSCGGNGVCGTCLIVASCDRPLAARNEIESEMAADRGFQLQERLACQIEPVDGLSVLVPSQCLTPQVDSE